MYGSRKYPYPPHGRPLEILGVGGLKAKFCKGKYETKPIFLCVLLGREGGVISFHGRGLDILWNNTIFDKQCCQQQHPLKIYYNSRIG